jgi:hypothetical protein
MQRFLNTYCLQYHRFILDPLSLIGFTILRTLPAEPQIDGLCNIQYFYYLVSNKFKIFVQKQSAMVEKIIHNNLCKENSLTVNVMANPSTQVVS